MLCAGTVVEPADNLLRQARGNNSSDGSSHAALQRRQSLPSSRFMQLYSAGRDCADSGLGVHVTDTLHPSAPHHLPAFITAPGDTDTLMVVVGVILVVAVMMVG